MLWLKAIRLPNLIIIAITQIIVKYGLINRYFNDLSTSLFPEYHFILLVTTTICLGIFAYLINDYFDYDLDRISNRKSKLNIAKATYYKTAWFTAIIGLVIACLLAMQAELLYLLWIYPLVCLVLYLYSRFLKANGLVGNIVVALFTSFVIYIVMISETAVNFAQHESLYTVLISFTIFSFLINLYREIIKDLEDLEEDKLAALKTLPIRIGQERTKLLAFFIGIVLLIVVITFGVVATPSLIPMIHVLCLVGCPLIIILFLNYKAKTTKDYFMISNLLRQIVLASGSPRRKFLLEQADLNFTINASDIEEIVPDHIPIREAPEYLAIEKAKACDHQFFGDEIILAADTSVFLNNEILNKPIDDAEARSMLKSMSKHTHEVITGVAIKKKSRVFRMFPLLYLTP